MGRLRGAHLTMVHNGETASVYRRFPRGQKSMWLSGASVLKKVLQGGLSCISMGQVVMAPTRSFREEWLGTESIPLNLK